MLTFCLAVALLGSAAAQIADTNCTAAGVYTATATVCSNKFSDASCAIVYADSTVATGADTERPAACFNGTNGPDEDVKAMAVENCPKTCGYCCESSEFDCENTKYPRINCATVTSRMCQDTTWRDIIAADCPAACGFCLLGGCIDTAPDCAKNPSICVTRGLETFVATNCKRTCGLCTTTTTASTGTGTATGTGCTGLTDNASCTSWVAKGFCTNTFYTAAQRKQYCPRACSLC